MPGEISLAHNGLLFLDELAEFDRSALEGLREPLEEGRVIISRVSGSVEYPAEFQLIAALNPCPCGYAGSEDRACVCSIPDRHRYQAKTSGPLLDRIDMRVVLRTVDPTKYKASGSQTSESIRERVDKARRILETGDCRMGGDVSRMLNQSIQRLKLSMRTRVRVEKVSKSIAALNGREETTIPDVAEALTYRLQSPFV